MSKAPRYQIASYVTRRSIGQQDAEEEERKEKGKGKGQKAHANKASVPARFECCKPRRTVKDTSAGAAQGEEPRRTREAKIGKFEEVRPKPILMLGE